MDLRLEHINKLTKDMLKNFGPNITENTALGCSRSVANVEKLLDSVDKDLQVTRPHAHHKTQKSESDFKITC